MSKGDVFWRDFATRIEGMTLAELEQIAPLGTILRWQVEDRVPHAVYEALVPTEALICDPQARWLKDHPEVRELYRGRFVAIHETLGLVAARDTYRELAEVLDTRSLDDAGIVIEYLR